MFKIYGLKEAHGDTMIIFEGVDKPERGTPGRLFTFGINMDPEWYDHKWMALQTWPFVIPI